MDAAEIKIIPATSEHRWFMVDAFVKQYCRMQKDLPGKLVGQMFETMLDSPNYVGQIATVEDHPEEWLGYILAHKSESKLAWFYVKSIYRHHGVGLALLAAAGLRKHKEIQTCFAGTPQSYEARAKWWLYRWKPYLPAIEAFEAFEADAIAGSLANAR